MRRITRSMTKQALVPMKTEIILKKVTNNQINKIPDNKLEAIMMPGMNKEMIREIINHPNQHNIQKKNKQPRASTEEITKNTDSYLATMIKSSKNTGLDKKKLDNENHNQIYENNYYENKKKIETGNSNINQEKLKNRSYTQIQNIPPNKYPAYKEPYYSQPAFMEDQRTSKISSRPVQMLNEEEYTKRMMQDKIFRNELEHKKAQQQEMRRAQMYPPRRGRRYTTGNDYVRHLEEDFPEIGKRQNVDIPERESMGLILNGKDRLDSLKKIKSKSNPTEKVNNDEPKELYQREINLGFKKELSIKSEKLENGKKINPILDNNQNANLAENLSNFEERNINMEIDVDIDVDHPKQEGSENGRVNVQVNPMINLEINGENREELVQQSGFDKGFTRKIDRIFQKSALSSDRELPEGFEMGMNDEHLSIKDDTLIYKVENSKVCLLYTSPSPRD